MERYGYDWWFPGLACTTLTDERTVQHKQKQRKWRRHTSACVPHDLTPAERDSPHICVATGKSASFSRSMQLLCAACAPLAFTQTNDPSAQCRMANNTNACNSPLRTGCVESGTVVSVQSCATSNARWQIRVGDEVTAAHGKSVTGVDATGRENRLCTARGAAQETVASDEWRWVRGNRGTRQCL
jgi:hypothetical protein